MENQHPVKLYGAILLAMVCFALSFVWFKVANISYGPLTIVFFRLLISTSILFVFTKLTRKLILPDKKDLKYLLLMAFFEPFLYFMGESFGLQYLSSTVAAVIIATIPLVAPLAALAFYGERITLRNIMGIMISFFGVTLVIYEVGVGLSASPIGVALQFTAVIAAVGYTVVLQKVSNRMNNLSIILMQNIIGSIYFFPFWLIFEKNRFVSTPFNPDAMLAIVYLAIFASTLAFIFFTYSVRHLGITKANMFTNTIPVFTAIFAWIILGDTLNVQKIAGIMVVISGLFMAQVRFKKKAGGPDPIPRT
ncbi:DMT family transporter [Roseimarinus sediminis]|uniref:DMT family transporter n=1 Tax=Roseimarinus sediminis TaxID=1610899 RepID=UPI003D19199F